MKKHNRIFLSFLLLIALLTAMAASVSALGQGEPDLNKKGIIGILLESEKDKTPIENADVTIFRVADAKLVDGKIVYTCIDSFSGFAKTLDDVKSLETAKKLFQYALDNSISGETKYTDNTGRTQFDDLTAGVYLISEIKGNTKYERFMPFLAVLPYDNNGKWEFNLIAKPKFGQISEDKSMDITVKKIWNDDGQNRPQSITAELLCDGSVFASVELSSENGWTHQWNDLDSTKKWSVREQQVPKDYTVTYSQNGNTYTIYNTRALIPTGQLKWPVPVLACGGLLLIIVGIVIRTVKRNGNE